MRHGRLELAHPDDRTCGYGSEGDPVRIALLDPALLRRTVTNADLAVGGAHMDGRLEIEGDDLRGFMTLANRATGEGGDVPAVRRHRWVARTKNRPHQSGRMGRARANVAHRHDLSPALHGLSPGDDRACSRAHLERPGMTLDEAQAARRRHIVRRLLLEPGMRVLDVGSGWGAWRSRWRGITARVVGITLSAEQLVHARACRAWRCSRPTAWC